MNLFNENLSGAQFSPDGQYRYKLWRIWDESLPLVMCIGLNPSTANAAKNDPTIRILIEVMRRLGYGGFYMTNLFAIISSQPHVLLTVKDPIGDNDAILTEVRAMCKDVVFCWGGFPQAEKRIAEIEKRFPGAKCFWKSGNGKPVHPMALMYGGVIKTATLIDY